MQKKIATIIMVYEGYETYRVWLANARKITEKDVESPDRAIIKNPTLYNGLSRLYAMIFANSSQHINRFICILLRMLE